MNKEIKIPLAEIIYSNAKPIDAVASLCGCANYGDLLEKILTTNWTYDILSSCGAETYASQMGKEYILYMLLYILNKLKPMPDSQLKEYLVNTDSLLEDIIYFLKREKGWSYDMRLALRFCRCVVVDYLYEMDTVTVDEEFGQNSLLQIINNYEEDMLRDRISNIDFIEYYDDQLNIYEGGECVRSYDKNKDVLRQLVFNRVLICEDI